MCYSLDGPRVTPAQFAVDAHALSVAADTGDAVHVFTAFEKQLGQGLEKTTVPLDVLVIGRLQPQRTEN